VRNTLIKKVRSCARLLALTENVTALVTAAGTIVAQGIMKSLRLASSFPDVAIRYRIVNADASPQAAGLYRGDSGSLVPTADSPDYIDSMCPFV
jgi:carbamoyl-phosphate synthase large subunit